jgi:hypothetical protein
MYLGGDKLIYKKVYTDQDFDYLECYLSFPLIGRYKEGDLLSPCSYKVTEIQAPTKISFIRSDIHWIFVFKILGFGFSLRRQWGY